ncbi:MAG: HlyD family secretion protein [Rhodospirillales bacterium]|nr:HlyD family secretion protein [Rhodospirillales bacterium]
MTQAQLERSTPIAPAPVTNLIPDSMKRRMTWRRILLLLGPIVLVLAGSIYYLFSGRIVSTDDAYIKSRMLSVTATVPGQVVAVPVNDNQTVKRGDVLVQIDPAPYRLRLASAEADLAQSILNADRLRAQVRSRQQDLVQANADTAYNQREFDRQKPLVSSGAVARSFNDKAQRDLISAQAKAASLAQQIQADLAQLGGSIDTPDTQLPSYLSALAARDTAAYNLEHATIRAAADGRVGAVTVRNGEYVAAGQNLFPQVVSDDTWVEANVRETDLTHVRDGQPATFTVDAYPGHTFKAHVQSFSPATGSELSVLPAENATGNWVKIVQRLPLKLTPELHPDDPPLRAGLSVNVEIDTGVYHHMPSFLRASSASESASAK